MSAPDRTRYRTTSLRGLVWRPVKGGRRYYGYIPGRGRVPLQARTFEEAKAEHGELRGRVGRGENVPSTTLKFAEVAEDWFTLKQGRVRPWTAKGYRRSLDAVLIPRFGHRKLRGIGYPDVLALVRHLEDTVIDRGEEKRHLSTSTINAHLLVLRSVFRYAQKAGHVSSNPVDLIDKTDRVETRVKDTARVWTDDEVATLLKASERLHAANKKNPKVNYTPLLRTALNTGLRLGELLGLQWGDIDLTEGTLSVRRQWTQGREYAPPKTRAALRTIPLSADMAGMFREMKLASRFSLDDDPVFASSAGTPLTHRNVQRRGFEAARDAAGIEGANFHSMRHCFASRMIANGIEATTLARLMGHANPAVTLKVYSHQFSTADTDDRVRKAMGF